MLGLFLWTLRGDFKHNDKVRLYVSTAAGDYAQTYVCRRPLLSFSGTKHQAVVSEKRACVEAPTSKALSTFCVTQSHSATRRLGELLGFTHL